MCLCDPQSDVQPQAEASLAGIPGPLQVSLDLEPKITDTPSIAR